MKLSQREIERANKRRKYSDGRGLFLSVSKNKTKTWAFCYRILDNGKWREREMSMGSIELLSLDGARDRAIELRRMVKNGIDPMEERDREQAVIRRAQEVGTSLRDVAEMVIEKKRNGWSETGRSEKSWRGSLEKHIFPTLGGRDVARIDRQEVRETLDPIWNSTPETAKRVLTRLEEIFDYAILEGWRTTMNPANRSQLRKLLGPQKRENGHFAALPFEDMPEFMTRLRSKSGIAPKALEFCILTALRTGDVIGATWDEIDFEYTTWSVPISRMKAGRLKKTVDPKAVHRVPLSPQALAILERLPREEGNPHVFISISDRKPKSGLSNMAMLKLLKDDMGLKGQATVHGFRSAFRDWASETTDHDPNAAEIALAHSISNKVEAAYRRRDLFEKRKPLMREWADYCSSKPENSRATN